MPGRYWISVDKYISVLFLQIKIEMNCKFYFILYALHRNFFSFCLVKVCTKVNAGSRSLMDLCFLGWAEQRNKTSNISYYSSFKVRNALVILGEVQPSLSTSLNTTQDHLIEFLMRLRCGSKTIFVSNQQGSRILTIVLATQENLCLQKYSVRSR